MHNFTNEESTLLHEIADGNYKRSCVMFLAMVILRAADRIVQAIETQTNVQRGRA